MINQQSIERLAEFMGWEQHFPGEWRNKNTQEFEHWQSIWNPFEKWHHWREIEERLMEDGKSQLMKDYLKYFDGKAHYIGTDLEERCQALLSILPDDDE